MVSTVAEGELAIAFRFCSCSSMLVSLERGLEGTLADRWWQAMLGMEEAVEMEEKGSCCNGNASSGFGCPLYITKEVEATSQLNEQTTRIVPCVTKWLLQQKPPNRHYRLSFATAMFRILAANSVARVKKYRD